MYSKPSFEIVEMDEEDIIQTSLDLEGNNGTVDLGDVGTFEWFKKREKSDGFYPSLFFIPATEKFATFN